MQNLSEFKRSLSLVLSLIFLAFVCCGCQISVTTKPSSSSESQALESSSDSKGEFAVKYKEHQIDFDEYLYMVATIIIALKDKAQNVGLEQFVSSENINGQPVVDWLKQNSIQRATYFLMAREKFKQLGKDLDSKSKKWVQDFSSDSKILEYAATMGVSKNGVKNHAEDYVKFTILKQKNVDLGKPEDDELTVNDEIVGKINMIDLAKRVEECVKNGANLIE